MKKFALRVQNLGQKAAQIQQAIKSVPPKIAEIREAVALTTGELQQLRADVQSSVAGLTAHDTASLSLALKEINGGTEVFQQAGYALAGVDLELSPSHRLTVHLTRIEDADEATLKSLIAANQSRRSMQALLSALLRAEEMAGSMQLTGLQYEELTVHIGPSPTVRMGWRPEAADDLTPSPPLPPESPAAHTEPPGFGQSSFFEKRLAQPGAPVVGPTGPALSAESSAPSPPTAAEQTRPPISPGGMKDLLERFKKDPHYSKYGR
jgi:hypothetical protein